MIILAALGWIASGLFAAGVAFADFQGSYPKSAEEDRRQDLGFSLFWGILGGPFAASLVIFLSSFLKHGWKLK